MIARMRSWAAKVAAVDQIETGARSEVGLDEFDLLEVRVGFVECAGEVVVGVFQVAVGQGRELGTR